MNIENVELVAHLKMLKNAEYIVLPEGASAEFENYGWGFEVDHGKPYKFSVAIAETYCYLNVEGFFGTDDEGYTMCCLEDMTPEEMMRFVPANEEHTKLMSDFKDLVSLVSVAADVANAYSNKHNLGEEVEWSADSGTIADWQSSRC